MFSLLILFLAIFDFLSGVKADKKFKIVDIIPYNGDHVIKLHMANIFDLVDLFVIVESKYTFSGQLKLNYSTDLHHHSFAAAEKAGKLLTLKIESYPFDASQNTSKVNWQRETYQRNYALPKVKEIMGNQSYILISGDADEILSKNAVYNIINRYDELTNGPIYFDLLNFMYSFKWYKKDEVQKTLALNDIYIRNNPEISLDKLRQQSKKKTILPNSGWHCGYFQKPELIVIKLKSFAHSADSNVNRPEIQNVQWVSHCMKYGIDILNRTYDWDLLHEYDGNRGFPSCADCNLHVTLHDELF